MQRNQSWMWSLALVGVIFLSALPFLQSFTASPVWDDYDILKGDAIGAHYGWKGAFTQPFNFGYYRPMVSLSFQLDRALFGTVPLFYHQTNLLIHLATVALVMALFWRMFRSRWGALAAGLLFGVQPMQVSTVAWIGGRTDSLCALFLTAFMLFLVLGFQSERRWGWISLSAVSLFAAMMCKEQSALAFFLVPPAYLLLRRNEDRTFRSWVLTLAPFFLACTAFVSLWIVSPFGKLAAEKHGLWEQLALGGRGLWHYALLAIAPTPSVLYTFTFENSREAGFWPILAGYAVLLASIVLLAALWRRRSLAFLFGLAALLFVLPVTNIVPIPSLSVGPYRIGIAGPSLAVLAAWALLRLRSSAPTAATIAVGAVSCWHYATSYWAVEQWQTEERFFSTVTKYDPAFYVARVNIAASYDTLEDTAIGHVSAFLDWVYQTKDWRTEGRAIELWKTDPTVERRIEDNAGTEVPTDAFMANAFLNLGLSQLRDGDLGEGTKSLRVASDFNPLDPNILTGLGGAYVKQGRIEVAEQCFKKAITLAKAHVPAHLEYAQLLESLERPDEAEREYRLAVKWMPWNGVTYLKLASFLVRQGRLADASSVLNQAVQKRAMPRSNADALMASFASVADEAASHP